MDPADDTDQPRLLFLLTHEVKFGDGAKVAETAEAGKELGKTRRPRPGERMVTTRFLRGRR